MEPNFDVVAAYWNARPCNIRHSPLEVGTREYFDEVEQRKYFVEPHIPAFADFHRWRGKRVLELGCGIGTDAINFARSGAHYTGIELSQESLDVTRNRFEVYNLPADLLLGNAELISQSIGTTEKFDLIYSFGVLHHTPNPAKALREASRFLDDNGEIRVMLYARPSWKSALVAAGLQQPEAQSGCPIAFSYTEDEVQNLFEQAGYRIIDLKRAHIFPYRLDAYLRYEYELEPWFEAMPTEMFRALEAQLGWHWLVTATIAN